MLNLLILYTHTRVFYSVLVLLELEKEFVVNQKVLAERSGELEELEEAASKVLQELGQKVTLYSNCL